MGKYLTAVSYEDTSSIEASFSDDFSLCQADTQNQRVQKGGNGLGGVEEGEAMVGMYCIKEF